MEADIARVASELSAPSMQIEVKTVNGTAIIDVNPASPLHEALMENLSEMEGFSTCSKLRVLLGGQELDDDGASFSEHGIEDMSRLSIEVIFCGVVLH